MAIALDRLRQSAVPSSPLTPKYICCPALANHSSTLDIGDGQFLQVAVGDVVARPVWHGIELDAMRELHIAGAKEPEEFLQAPTCPPRCCSMRREDCELNGGRTILRMVLDPGSEAGQSCFLPGGLVIRLGAGSMLWGSQR